MNLSCSSLLTCFKCRKRDQMSIEIEQWKWKIEEYQDYIDYRCIKAIPNTDNRKIQWQKKNGSVRGDNIISNAV